MVLDVDWRTMPAAWSACHRPFSQGALRHVRACGCREMEAGRHQQCRGWVGFNVRLAHRITAGADLLLMPSRFEPCGLNQLYAMAYGTVPIVHAVRLYHILSRMCWYEIRELRPEPEPKLLCVLKCVHA